MKNLIKPKMLPLFTLIAGILGALFKIWQLSAGIDENGLLIAGHMSNALIIVLSILTLAVLLTGVRPLGHTPAYGHLFPRSVHAAAGNSLTAAALILYSIKVLILPADSFALILGLLGFFAAGSLLYLGWCRFKALRPSFLLHGIITAYLMLHTITQYRIWGSEPQIALYWCQLFCGIFLMLTGYQRTLIDSGTGKRIWFVFCNQAALFFCLLSFWGENWLYYLAMAVWTGTNLCSLKIMKKHCEEPENAMPLPDDVLFLMRQLEASGYTVYVVGGCVRDHLLQLRPHDYDLCTSATPEEICMVFSDLQTVRTGEKHGTVGVVINDQMYEITTYRKEFGYADGRHPDQVLFVSSVEEDLSRRDFTINAIAYSPKTGFIDPWGGQQDLSRGILRTVGDPNIRFQEDSLRILRGVRFAVRFGLIPERDTEKTMEALAPLMCSLAKERIFDELCKLLPVLTYGDMRRFSSILIQVIPELAPSVGFDQHSPHHAYDVYSHTAYVVETVPAKLSLRWAALLHDIGKPETFTADENGRGHFHGHAQAGADIADRILRRLKAPNALRESVITLIENHMLTLEPDKKLLRRRLSKLGKETVFDLLALQKADYIGKGVDNAPNIAFFDQIEDILNQLLAEDACLSVKDLAINGRDILALGYAPGPQIGACMSSLLTQVLDETVSNDRESLLEAARQFFNQP